MEYPSNHTMEKRSWATAHCTNGRISVSERGFTYIEAIVSFALITSLFPIIFGFFFQVASSVRIQLSVYQLWESFDRFQLQMMNDAANGIKIIADKNQIVMVMKDGQQVRYILKNSQLVRSLKKSTKDKFRGNTILLYHVKKIDNQKYHKGIKMYVTFENQGALFTGNSYIWGRIDE